MMSHGVALIGIITVAGTMQTPISIHLFTIPPGVAGA